MKAEERAELRKRHQQSTLHIDGVDVRTFDACRHCEDVSWPCDVVLLLDALKAAEAENERLRAVLAEAKGNLLWATGGWGAWNDFTTARNTLQRYLDAIDAALVTTP